MAAASSGHVWEANGRIRQLSGYRTRRIYLHGGGAILNSELTMYCEDSGKRISPAGRTARCPDAASWILGLNGQADHWPTMGV